MSTILIDTHIKYLDHLCFGYPASISGADTATLTYDPNGCLYQTVVYGVVTRFIYDGDALVMGMDGALL